MTESIDKLTVKIGADVDSAIRGIGRVDKSVDKLDQNTSKSSTSMQTATGKMSKSFATVAKAGLAAAAAAATIGAALATRSAANASADMEQYVTTLRNLYGTQEQAAEQIKWILDFAKTTPFEVKGLVEATTKLKAYGIEGQDVLGTLGDTAAAMGKPINMAVEALADAQTGEFERLKEFGVKAVQITQSNAVAIGVSAEQAGQTALTYTDRYGQQRAQVIDRNNREIIQSTLTSIWNEKYAGGMEAQSKTFRGLVSNIKDGMFQAGLSVMGFEQDTATFRDGSLFDGMKKSVSGMLGSLNSIDFTAIGQGIESAISTISTKLAPAREAIGSVIGSIKGIIDDFMRGFSGTNADLSGFVKYINAAAVILGRLFKLIDESDIFKQLGQDIKFVINIMSTFYNTIADTIVGGINLAIDAYNRLVPAMQAVGMDVERVMKITFDNVAKSAEEGMQSAADAVKDGQQDVNGPDGPGGGPPTSPGTEAAAATVAGSIPSWAGHGDYIRGQLQQTGASNIGELLDVGASTPEATTTPTIPTAQKEANPNGSTAQKEGNASIIARLQAIEKAILSEPRKVDIDMDIDIENHSDISGFETTLAKAIAAGVHGNTSI